VELRALKKALVPFTKKIEAVYRPIRHLIAHNLAISEAEKAELFSKANIGEIDEILYFLHDLMQNLWQLYYNGRIPELGTSDRHYKERIKSTTKHALRRLHR